MSSRRAALVSLTACLAVACARPPDPAAQRVALLMAIAEQGAAAAGFAPQLVDMLIDPALVDLAIWALGELGPAAGPTAVPPLLDLQVSGNPLRHAAVCIALGHLGDRRQEVLDYLAAAAASPFVIVRQAARGAS